jgi:hypothetical protein
MVLRTFFFFFELSSFISLFLYDCIYSLIFTR